MRKNTFKKFSDRLRSQLQEVKVRPSPMATRRLVGGGGQQVVDEDDEAGEGSGRGGGDREALDGSDPQPPAKRGEEGDAAPEPLDSV